MRSSIKHHVAAVGMKRHWDPRAEQTLCTLFKQSNNATPYRALPKKLAYLLAY